MKVYIDTSLQNIYMFFPVISEKFLLGKKEQHNVIDHFFLWNFTNELIYKITKWM